MYQPHTQQTYSKMDSIRYDRRQETALAERQTAAGAEYLYQGYGAQHKDHSPYDPVAVKQLFPFRSVITCIHIPLVYNALTQALNCSPRSS